MAKSIRSKSRQKALSVRRKKYLERERQKAWAHYLRVQAERTVEMGDVQEHEEGAGPVDDG